MGYRAGPARPGTAGQPDSPMGELRRMATRRRLLGRRVRRVLPGLVVGSATLTGTAAVAAWVGDQPDVRPAPAAAATPPTTKDPLGALAGRLRADTEQVNALQSALAELDQQRAAAAAAPGATVGAGASQAAASPSVTPLATLPPLPPIPSVSIGPAPVVNATTGASHAVP